jgi:hypothetical protein
MSERTVRAPSHPADSVAAERLWDALYVARAGRSRRLVADLEDAAFRRYLPWARTLVHAAGLTQGADRTATEQVAELGLANAVLAWPGASGPAPGSAGSPTRAPSGNCQPGDGSELVVGTPRNLSHMDDTNRPDLADPRLRVVSACCTQAG